MLSERRFTERDCAGLHSAIQAIVDPYALNCDPSPNVVETVVCFLQQTTLSLYFKYASVPHYAVKRITSRTVRDFKVTRHGNILQTESSRIQQNLTILRNSLIE